MDPVLGPSASRSTSARREARRIALLLGVLLTACAARQSGEADALGPLGLIPPPPTIATEDAQAYVDDVVAIDTRIASARVDGGKAMLVPASSADGGLEVVIAPPLTGPSAAELAAKYNGQDVRAIGRVTNLGGRLELLIGDPSRIEVVGAAPAAAAAPAVAARPTTTPAKGATPAAAPETASAPRQAPASVTRVAQSEGDGACAAARDAWRKASLAAKPAVDQLSACLAAGRPPCSSEMSKLRVALAEVAASEERLQWVCRAAP
jgi:hypothetical protein